MTSAHDNSFDFDALARYVAGESDASERAAVETALAADQAMARLLQAVRNTTDTSADDVDIERGLQAVRAKMDVLSLDDARARRPSQRFRLWTAGIVAAAALVILVGRRITGHTGPASVYATVTGQALDVSLSDGSTVHLGPSSRLEVPASFSTERGVKLTGIARFTVRHDPAHPFVVQAGGAHVEDVGTIFTVRTDDDGGSVAVVVTDGSVRLKAVADGSGDGVVLQRGDRGVVSGASVVAEPGTATVGDTAWASGDLVFEDASMERVRSDLRRWYGVAVVTGDSAIAARHLTATFGNDSIDQVVRILGLALDAQVVRRGDTVYIGAHR